jgi:ElaB/YqjD/DUF883 family membrane-anchored ribosome-binding protein
MASDAAVREYGTAALSRIAIAKPTQGVCMRELLNGLDTVVQRIEQLLRGAADGIERQANDVGDELATTLRETRERLEDIQRDLQRALSHTARTTDRYVRSHPWPAIAIAAGAALALGALLASRSGSAARESSGDDNSERPSRNEPRGTSRT